MRTTKEIIEHYDEVKDQDSFGFQGEILCAYLSADDVRPFCKADAELSDWEPYPLTEEGVLGEMRDYMEFAWGKVENHRGISASRSVEKMEAWVWVLGRDDLLQALGGAEYENYGAPKLKAVCDVLQFPLPESEQLSRMSQGLPCRPNCDEGCGS